MLVVPSTISIRLFDLSFFYLNEASFVSLSSALSIIFQLSTSFILNGRPILLSKFHRVSPFRIANSINYLIPFRNFGDHSLYCVIFMFYRIPASFSANLFILFQFNFDQRHSSKLFRVPISTVTYKSLVCILNSLISPLTAAHFIPLLFHCL